MLCLGCLECEQHVVWVLARCGFAIVIKLLWVEHPRDFIFGIAC